MNAPVSSVMPVPDLDLRSLSLLLWARCWWLMAAMFLFAGVFAVVALLTEPAFRATSVLAPARAAKAGLGGLGSTLSEFGGLASLAGLHLDSSDSST